MVRCHSYRTARVNSDLQIDREVTDALEKDLARQAGVRLDNHVVYVVPGRRPWSPDVGFFFTDTVCVIGEEIVVEDW